MSFATFSAQNIVQEFLRETGISLETFCSLQFEPPRIQRWSLDRILKNERSIDELSEGPRLIRLVQACRAFQRSMPVDVDWSDPRVAYSLAREYRIAAKPEPEQIFVPNARE
jgi:hypothetical protein